MVRVSFVIDDEDVAEEEKTVLQLTKIYGADLTEEDYPELVAPEGTYVFWNTTSLSDIVTDTVVEAQYKQYHTTIGEWIFGEVLVDGQFRDDDVLRVERTYLYDTSLSTEELLADAASLRDYETLTVEIPDDEATTHTLRFRPITDFSSAYTKWNLYLVTDSGRTLLTESGTLGEYSLYTVEGNHLVIDVEFADAKEVAEKNKLTRAAVIAGIVVVVLLILWQSIRHRKGIRAGMVAAKEAFKERSKRRKQLFFDDRDEIIEGRMRVFTIAAEMENLRRAMDFIDGKLDNLGCNLKIQSNIDLAVEELFANAVNIAYADAAGEVTLKYGYDKEKHTVLIIVEDSGKAYDPLAFLDGEGNTAASAEDVSEDYMDHLGILMIRKMMDSYTYAYRDGKNINKIKKVITIGDGQEGKHRKKEKKG